MKYPPPRAAMQFQYKNLYEKSSKLHACHGGGITFKAISMTFSYVLGIKEVIEIP